MLPISLLRSHNTVVVAVLAASALAALYSTVTRVPKTPKDANRVPYLPSSVPFLGNTIEVAANTMRLLDWVAEHILERDGKPIALRLLGRNDLIYTANPEHFEQVLKTQSSNFGKGVLTRDVYSDFMGEGILLTNGDRWKYHRRVLVNLFSARALREFMTPVIQKNVQVLVGILSRASETTEPIDLYKLMNKFTFETFTEIGFGRQLGSLDSPHDHPFEQAFDQAHRISGKRFTAPGWLWRLKRWLNVGTERCLKDAMVVTNGFIMDTISSAVERRRVQKDSGEQHANKDVVSIVLDTMESSGQSVTPTDIRDIVFAGLIAGRDTTADGMSWLMHLLHQNPRVLNKLRQEISSALPNFASSDSYVPSMEDVQELPYLEATIRELLRLYPAAPTIPYNCTRDTVFPDGTFIPAGTAVFLALYTTARLESVWRPDAASFVPERFLDQDTGKLLPLSSTKFVPFSAGPRVCVGRNLALLEMKLVAATLVSRFQLEEVPGQNVTYSRGVSIGMKKPLLVTIKRVANCATSSTD
ncbi:hypothetical protein PHYBOEH_003474 [Phytophthora boehmeriae]|uniref:Cytochrome P450 n=1 Tax=Phytophthora boehmeriae TaxID=109152 RepID=A0A8T1X873_9STRA|nr:hypothetical protein PHYBOEH_003474 [Phytophthora boehmeriae]